MSQSDPIQLKSVDAAVQMVRRHPRLACRSDIAKSLSEILSNLSLSDDDTQLLQWPDDRRADLAYMLLLSLPAAHLSNVQARLLPLLHFDILSLLPPELARHVLKFLDVEDVLRCSMVSKAWRKLAWEDQLLWKNLYLQRGWKYDAAAVEYWNLLEEPLPSSAIPHSKLPKHKNIAPDEGMSMDMEPSPVSDTLSVPEQLGPGTIQNQQYNPLLNNNTTNEPSSSTSLHTSLYSSLEPPGLPPSPRHFGYRAPSPTSFSLSQPSTQSAFTTPRNSSKSSFQPSLMRRAISADTFETSPSSSSSSYTTPIDGPSRSISVPRLRVSAKKTTYPSPPRHFDPSHVTSVHYDEAGKPRVHWRHMFISRMTIAKNWRRGRFVSHELRSPHSLHLNIPPPITPKEWPVSAEHAVYCLQIVGQTLVAGFRQAVIRQFCLVTGNCLHALKFHEGSVLCLQVALESDHYDPESRDKPPYAHLLRLANNNDGQTGTLIVSGSSDGTIVYGDLNSGVKFRTLKGHTDSVLALRFEHDYLITCSKDRSVKVWSMTSGHLLHDLVGHGAAVNAIQLSVADSIVCSASGDRTVKIWNLKTGQALKQFTAHDRGIATLKLQLKGTVVQDRQQLKTDKTQKPDDSNSTVRGIAMTGSSDRTIRLHELDTEVCRLMIGSSDDGRDVGMPALNAALGGTMFNPPIPQQIQRSGHTDLVRTLEADEGLGVIVSGSYDQSIKIFDFDSGDLLVDIEEAHANRILKLQMSLTRLVSCAQDSRIIVWDFFHGDTSFMTL